VRPGDVIMHNDAYGGASHGPDVAFVVPVFSSGRTRRFAATTAPPRYRPLSPGSCGIVDAIDAYAEGLQFQGALGLRPGIRNDAVWQLLRDKSASPPRRRDMEAQIAASRIRARPRRADRALRTQLSAAWKR